MSTITELMDGVKDRTGVTGTTYDVQITRCINRSIQEICSVLWGFLYSPDGLITTDTDITKYYLPEDFSVLDDENIYCGADKVKMIPGDMQDIFFNTLSAPGQPQMYNIANHEFSAGIPRQLIYIGTPTADAAYAVVFAYWRKLPTYTALEYPLISLIYGDQPILSGSSWILWKDLEQNAKATDCFLEFCGDMRVMQSKMKYRGSSYDELVQLRNQVANTQGG